MQGHKRRCVHYLGILKGCMGEDILIHDNLSREVKDNAISMDSDRDFIRFKYCPKCGDTLEGAKKGKTLMEVYNSIDYFKTGGKK